MYIGKILETQWKKIEVFIFGLAYSATFVRNKRAFGFFLSFISYHFIFPLYVECPDKTMIGKTNEGG